MKKEKETDKKRIKELEDKKGNLEKELTIKKKDPKII